MFSRKLLTSTFAALTLGAAAFTSTSASALSPYPYPYPYYGYGGGYVAAGVIGGMALGAMAASASAHRPVYVESDCYIIRRKVLTAYGVVTKRVRVCE